ncbi:cutinase, partial [Tothia fuscella]
SAGDLLSGQCKGVMLIFARGTTEGGNIGHIVASPLVRALKAGIKDLGVQGVKYPAGVATNMGPGGADQGGVAEAKRLLEMSASKCPNTIIIGGGYSQGAAVMHGAAKALAPNVVAKIAGIALFGDTQNKQSGGHIKGLPVEKSKVFCASGDGVCSGALMVNAAHMSYASGGGKLKEGADWLIARVNAA